MVPSGYSIENITVSPLELAEIELPDLIVLFLRVPASVNEKFLTRSILSGKDRAAASSFWRASVDFELLPLFGLEIEGMNIVEVLSLVVDTTVATENDNFAFVNAGSAVGSRSGGSDVGLFVFHGRLATDSSPFHFFDVEDPGVIESSLSTVVATENEKLICFCGGLTDVLRSSKWFLSSLSLLLIPGAFFCNYNIYQLAVK